MNKAFTRESDYDPTLDVVARPREILPPGVKNYVTPDGAERVRGQLRNLSDVVRPRLLETLAEMARQGRQDDTAHIDVRRSLRQVDGHIDWLSERVAGFEVVDPSTQDPDKVHFGATVTVLDSEGQERTWQIVGIDEAAPGDGRVSWISPVARGLLSRQVGDAVLLELPRGQMTLKILEIAYDKSQT